MNPTWYDVLGIEQDSTPEQIKSAWRAATDSLEPGTESGRFRRLNEAADVLLDPQRRAAYDRSLERDSRKEQRKDDRGARRHSEPSPSAAQGDQASQVDHASRVDRAGRPSSNLASPVMLGAMALLAVLAVAAVVVAFVFSYHHRQDEATLTARTEAQSTASRALVAVLSYDYRHMQADRSAALRFLTPGYQREFEKSYKLLTTGKNGGPGPVETTKTVVTANIADTAIVDSDPDTVRVLAFVNQSASKAGGTPSIFQNRVAVTMVKRGDSWLIQNLASY